MAAMNDWNTSTWISVLSLAISVISVASAIGSPWIARKSLDHARDTYYDQVQISFERERSALLDLITRNRSEFEKTRLRIDSLKDRYKSSLQPVKEILRKDADLLDAQLHNVEGAIRQCLSLWDEVARWDGNTGIHALVYHQSRYKALMEDDRFDQDSWLMVVGAFDEKIKESNRICVRSHQITTFLANMCRMLTESSACADVGGN